jgi:hypothetical protein
MEGKLLKLPIQLAKDNKALNLPRAYCKKTMLQVGKKFPMNIYSTDKAEYLIERVLHNGRKLPMDMTPFVELLDISSQMRVVEDTDTHMHDVDRDLGGLSLHDALTSVIEELTEDID